MSILYAPSPPLDGSDDETFEQFIHSAKKKNSSEKWNEWWFIIIIIIWWVKKNNNYSCDYKYYTSHFMNMKRKIVFFCWFHFTSTWIKKNTIPIHLWLINFCFSFIVYHFTMTVCIIVYIFILWQLNFNPSFSYWYICIQRTRLHENLMLFICIIYLG